MKIKKIGLAALFFISVHHLWAQGTAFTYQSVIRDGSAVANGTYDFVFSVYDGPSNPVPIVTGYPVSGVPVTNGLMTVLIDFGTGIFTGPDRWLGIAMRTNATGGFILLAPRQRLTPAPYTVAAGSVTGPVSASQLSGAIGSAQLTGTYAAPLSLTSPANTFLGNGTGLTNVNAVSLGGFAASSFWKTTGNSGTTAGVNFLGTTDNQPLELRVRSNRGFRLEAGATDAVNVIGGSAANNVGGGAIGATISGGGTTNYGGGFAGNVVAASYASIGGGVNNVIQTNALGAVIAGGMNNVSLGSGFVGGGQANIAGASSVVAGGISNQTGFGYAVAIGGGALNSVDIAVAYGTIAGGQGNFLQSAFPDNTFGETIGGGMANFVHGNFATVPGGSNNAALGDFSFAAGKNAWAGTRGSFVWADSQDATFASTAVNQFAIRADNGVVIAANATNTALELRTGGALKVTGAGVGTTGPVFIHRAITGVNIAGDYTTIDNPLCNGDPNAILLVTPNYNPGGTGGTYNNHPVGVFYIGGRWAIFNQDLASMLNNAAFNVLVFKP